MLSLLLSVAAAVEPPELVGHWRMELVLTTRVLLPVLGGMESWTRSILDVEILRRGEQLWQRHRTCAVELGAKPSLARTVVPPAFIAALPERSYPLDLQWTPEGWRSLADPLPLAVGFDPAKGPMPRELGDPALVDFDGDGQPGASVEVEVPMLSLTGQVWVVQEGHTVFLGEELSADRIAGRAELRLLQQHSLGATHRWLVSNPQLRVVPEQSRFEMRRVPTGGC